MQNHEQPIRSQEISKERKKQKSKVSTVDIQVAIGFKGIYKQALYSFKIFISKAT